MSTQERMHTHAHVSSPPPANGYEGTLARAHASAHTRLHTETETERQRETGTERQRETG